MKANYVKNVLVGISATSVLIGLGLLGFAMGVYLKTGLPVSGHALFDPAINCVYTGLAIVIFMIIISLAKGKTAA